MAIARANCCNTSDGPVLETPPAPPPPTPTTLLPTTQTLENEADLETEGLGSGE